MILPIKYPFASTYPFIANPLAILLTHEETFPWLMNNFIQIRGITLQEALNTYLDYCDFEYKNCPYLNVQKISKDIITSKWKGVLDFIKESIDRNYYVYMLAKIRFIPAYGIKDVKDDIVHDLMVYGYSDEEGKFFIADNFNGRYQFSQCTYVELEDAVNNILPEEEMNNDFDNCIVLMKYINRNIGINIARIKQSLKDYLYCRATQQWYNRQYEPWMETKAFIFRYGRENYEDIDEIIAAILNLQKFPDNIQQPLHLITQHRQIMYMRYKFLFENGYVKNERLLQDFELLSNKSSRFLYLLIKNTLSNKKKNKIVIKRYNEIKDFEERCLNEFIAELSVN